MKKELHIFFTCLMFYTRIPCPKNIDHNPDYLNKATRYFPFIGWIVGSTSFLTFYLFSLFLSIETAVILAIIASILTTGAFHEDGFADVCDGFGGGWTKDHRPGAMMQIDSKLLPNATPLSIDAYRGAVAGYAAFAIRALFDSMKVVSRTHSHQ